jgi:two-component sensor histidine kinase
MQIDASLIDRPDPVTGERAAPNSLLSKPGRTAGHARTWAALQACPPPAPRREPLISMDATRDITCGLAAAESGDLRASALPGPIPPLPATAGDPVAALQPAGQAPDSLARHRAALLRTIPADGVALRLDGQPGRLGQAPPEPVVAALAQWLDGRAAAGVLALDALPAASPVAGRLLAISLPRTPCDWVIWLRPAKAARWSRAEIAAATALRIAWLEAGLRRAAQQAAEGQAAQSHQAFVMAELDHRLKNILANIQALLRHSRRRAAGTAIDADAFVRNFEARLHAMAAAHDLLHASRWEGARLRPLIAEELGPHADGLGCGRIATRGRDLVLRPRAAMSLSLALHELATNAAKHGALSVPDGNVALRWRRTQAGLVLQWEEHGGPPAAPPTRRGFGLTVIERSLAYELGGSGQLDFTPLGLRCTIRIPAEHMAPAG